MHSTQSFNSYFNAFQRVAKLNQDQLEFQIRECAKPFFSLKEVGFEEFQNDYSASSVLLNKLKTPYAFINVLQGVYHLAIGILTLSKMTLYTAVRDFQEGWGRIVRFVDDEKGTFIIERSLFHKSAYEYYVNYTPENKQTYNVNGFELPRLDQASRFTLLDLKRNPTAIVTRFNLEGALSHIEKEAFLNKIENFDDYLLSKISIEDFLNETKDILSHFLISDEELANLSFDDITGISRENTPRLLTRLSRANMPESKATGITLYKMTKTLKAVSLLEKMPLHLYVLFSDEQLLELDLSKLDPYQIYVILSRDNAKTKEIFTKIPSDKLESLYDRSAASFKYISDDQLKNLKNPTADVLRAIFPDNNETHIKFALFPASVLQPVLATMDDYLFDAITDDQLQGFDYKELCPKTICKLISSRDETLLKKRISLLSPKQLTFVLPQVNQVQRFISDEKIKEMPYSDSDLSFIPYLFETYYYNAESRLKLLPVETVQLFLDKLNYSLRFIPDNYLAKLNLSKLGPYQLSLLLNNRISQLSKDHLEQIITHIDYSMCTNLSVEQVRQLDFSKMTSAQISATINVRIKDITDLQLEYLLSLKKEQFPVRFFAQLSVEQVQKYIDKFNDDQIACVFYNGASDASKKMAALRTTQAVALIDRPVALGNWISEKQIIELDFSTRSKEQITKFLAELQHAFNNSYGPSRIHELTPKQIQDILPHFTQIELITEKQFKQLDFSLLSMECIHKLVGHPKSKKWVTKPQLAVIASKQYDPSLYKGC